MQYPFSRILQKNFKFINKIDAEKCSLFWCQFFAATQDLELNRKAQRRKNGMRIFCGWTKSDQKSFSHKTWSIITLCFLLKILVIILQCFRSKVIRPLNRSAYPTSLRGLCEITYSRLFCLLPQITFLRCI